MRKIAIGLAAVAIAMGGSTLTASARTIVKYVCPSHGHAAYGYRGYYPRAAYYPRGGGGGIHITKKVIIGAGAQTGPIRQYRAPTGFGAARGIGRR